jgi:hypothetical protein
MSTNQTSEPNSQSPSEWQRAGHAVREQFHYLSESPEPTAHESEMLFLRRLMRYDHSDESQVLEGKMHQAERNERCARRAVWLMALLTAVAVAGFGYAAIMSDGFPINKSQVIIRAFCVLGLASLVSLIAFISYWLVSRAAISEQRDECRQLVTRIVEARLGKPPVRV